MATRLLAGEPVSSTALAGEFLISEDAIRRDLRALAAAGICRRVYGGAVPLLSSGLPISARLKEGLVEKRALARAVLPLIPRQSFVFLDSGSTNVMAAEVLPDDADLSIGTNSIEAAATLAARQDLPMLFAGGGVHLAIGGCVDGAAIEAVSRLNIDVCLLGVCALSAENGVSAFDAADAAFKRVLIARSRCTIILVSNEKLAGHAPHRIAGLSDVDHVVVSHDAPEDAVAKLELAGVKVLRAGLHQTN
ncbi:transcriptional regulator, DeoR family [Sphingobium sp. AP50]|nr:transcriptional regulator, DeoR family [Sphingobium sp. AP50]